MPGDNTFSSFWDVAGNKGEGTRIALLDTGVDRSHPQLRNANIVAADLINPGGSGIDIDGHGTACAGLILSIAPGCTLLSGRIMDRGGAFTYDSLISALYWAAIQKADIVCICSGARHSDLMCESKLTDLEKEGTIVLAAVGNHGAQGPGAFPARSNSCVAVGTANTSGELSSFTALPAGKEVYCLPGEEFITGSQGFITGTSASTAAMAGIFGLLVASGGASNGLWKHKLAYASRGHHSERGYYFLVDARRLISQGA